MTKGEMPGARRTQPAEQALKEAQDLFEEAHEMARSGKFEDVLGPCGRLSGRFERLGLFREAGGVCRLRGDALLNLGQVGEAVSPLLQASRLLERAADPAGAAEALCTLGFVFRRLGRPRRAEAMFQRSLRILPADGCPEARMNTQLLLIDTLVSLGRLQDAGEFIQGIREDQVRPDSRLRLTFHQMACCIHLWLGELDASEQHLAQRYRIGSDSGNPLVQADSLCALADLRQRRGDWWGARELFRQAAGLAQGPEGRILQGRILLALREIRMHRPGAAIPGGAGSRGLLDEPRPGDHRHGRA